jgi:hypothetical protein
VRTGLPCSSAMAAVAHRDGRTKSEALPTFARAAAANTSHDCKTI